jgi:uncharacterized protein YacL
MHNVPEVLLRVTRHVRHTAGSVSLYHLAELLDRTRWSVALHQSVWVYPVIESVHVLCLCLFLGMAILLDLRLLGVTMKKVPVSEVAGRLLPWTVAGFIVMVITGALLFYGIPLRTYTNIFFRIKVALLLLAGINVWIFHSGIYLKIADWDTAAVPPARARMAGALSLVLWAGVVVAGRMIAYNWFDKPAH